MLLLKKVLIACLKFKFHWAFCTLSHNPVTVSTKASITWRLCPGLMDSFPRWLLNEPSKLTVVVCRRNQFLATRISFWAAWASLCWQLASSSGWFKRGQCHLWPCLKSHTLSFLNFCIDCPGISIHCGKRVTGTPGGKNHLEPSWRLAPSSGNYTQMS